MFFHTHVYYAKKMNSRLNNLVIIGSILPDFAITSAISWDDLHKRKGILEFSSFVNTNYPNQKSLLLGIQYHNIVDYFSHLKYGDNIGYAYVNSSSKLINLVSKAFSIDAKLARSTAHNFIESAVEFYVLKQNSELSSLVKNAVDKTNIKRLADIISHNDLKSSEDVKISLHEFFSLVTKYDLKNVDDWILLWEELGMHLFKKAVRKEILKEALDLSFTLVKSNHTEFLNTVISVKQPEIVDSN